MFRFEYKAYRRTFAGGFSNARESFSHREGILLRLEDKDGRVGFGEAAPLLSFGTESFPSALSAAEAIDAQFQPETLLKQLGDYPSLLWGIESAIADLDAEGVRPETGEPWPVCALIGSLANDEGIEEAMRMGYRCLKFKIGISDWLTERRQLDRVIELTDGERAIRLDANASLNHSSARRWLESVVDLPIEFIEQPMPVGEEREMMRLAADFPVALALDESVSSVDDLKRWRDAQWNGVYVIKPSLSGSRFELSQELSMGSCDLVFSTALETKVGSTSALTLALGVDAPRRALGFGADRMFSDRNIGLELGPFLQSDSLPRIDDIQFLWNQI